MRSSQWLRFIGSMMLASAFSGCMSVLQYHENDGVTKRPYSGMKTDLGIAASTISDPELRGTFSGVALFAMSAIDAPLSFVADTILLPRDLRRQFSAPHRIRDERSEHPLETGE